MNAIILSLLLQANGPVAVEEHIARVAPQMPAPRIKKLAGLIHKVAEKHELDPAVLTAIVRQESSFRSGLKVCRGIERAGVCRWSCDYGMAQINSIWIQELRLDPDRLKDDDYYNLSVAAKILRRLKEQWAAVEPKWYTRYHSNLPQHRAVYEADMERWL